MRGLCSICKLFGNHKPVAV